MIYFGADILFTSAQPSSFFILEEDEPYRIIIKYDLKFIFLSFSMLLSATSKQDLIWFEFFFV